LPHRLGGAVHLRVEPAGVRIEAAPQGETRGKTNDDEKKREPGRKRQKQAIPL